jgi:uncharacterized protein (TIRG00374 family)
MRAHVRTILIVVLTASLLAWFLSHASLSRVWAEIRNARPGALAGAVAITGATYVLRAFRWQYLLSPIGRTEFSNAFRATVIGFAATFLLPARAGEVVRPYLLARWERLSATASFATIILERVLDLVTVLFLFASFLLIFDPGVGTSDAQAFGWVKAGGLIAAIGAAVALAIMFALAGHPERLGRAALGIERILPARAAHLMSRLVQLFAEGLAVMRQPRRLLIALALSLPLWLSIATGIWLTTLAFHITLPFTASFLLMALLVVGVSLPTPGAVGGFHEAFRIGLTTFYHVANDKAVSAAIVLHAVSFVPVTILGVLFMAQAGLSLHETRAMIDRGGPDGASEPRGARAPGETLTKGGRA